MGSLDVALRATKHTRLDRINSLALELKTGWNSLTACEIRVKAATGGLRLLTTDTVLPSTSAQFSKPPEVGLLTFASLARDSSTKLHIPFSVEQDVSNISVRVQVSYTTENGNFTFAKSFSIPVALALGVNVQDIFKHKALFSRFTVSTATPSPLRLIKSELSGSDIWKAGFGVPPNSPVAVFPKQPASLLYRITREKGVDINAKTEKTMHLQLHYSVLHDEIEALVEASLTEALTGSTLWTYYHLIVGNVLEQVKIGMSTYELERAVLLSELQTLFLADINWESHFEGIGMVLDTEGDAATSIASFLRDWQKKNTKLALAPPITTQNARSITIPVDVPSILVLHTADIQLQLPPRSPPPLHGDDTPVVSTNQLLPAVLHLAWTRTWDTTTKTAEASVAADLSYSYEVTAPPDTWLLGGRRRGHVAVGAADGAADIPLLLVPLREGWLPYPTVEIRQVLDEESSAHCEVDYRNIGETVRVVADREKVTLSLDASGPGGGPLVLESERSGHDLGRVVA
jgi:trafficking protein particle complex subunit 10